MDVLEVYPKDWFVRVELSLDQIRKLLDFLDNCTVNIDPKNRELVAAKDYVIGDFFAKLDKLSEEIMVRRGS
jgi:hypothetical protein